MTRQRKKDEMIGQPPQYWRVYFGDRYVGKVWAQREAEAKAQAISDWGPPKEGESLEVLKEDPTK